MPGLFANLGVDIPALIDASLSDSLLPATLVKFSPGVPSSSMLTAGANPEKKTYPCRGVVTDYSAYEMAQGLVKLGERKILLIANSIASAQVPEPNDQIQIEGGTWRVCEQGVTRDPAAAAYTCKVRR